MEQLDSWDAGDHVASVRLRSALVMKRLGWWRNLSGSPVRCPERLIWAPAAHTSKKNPPRLASHRQGDKEEGELGLAMAQGEQTNRMSRHVTLEWLQSLLHWLPDGTGPACLRTSYNCCFFIFFFNHSFALFFISFFFRSSAKEITDAI